MTGTGGWGEGRGSPKSAALGRGHCRGSLKLLQSPPGGRGGAGQPGGLDAPRLTFHHRFLWQAEAHLRRLPSACLGLNMSCGACQGLLAPSWIWHHQLCAQPRPRLVPVQTIPLRGEKELGPASRGSWCPGPQLARPPDPPLPQPCMFPAPSLSSSSPARCVSPCGTQTRPPTPPTPAERAVHSLAQSGRAPRMQWTEE